VIRGLGRRRQTVLATLTPGDFFGEMSLLDDYPRSASIRATEPAQCLVMTRWDFLAEVNKQPDMAVHLLRTLANRLRVTNANLTTLVRRLRVTAPEFTE
jgi:CRP-like cAMP-binding protein